MAALLQEEAKGEVTEVAWCVERALASVPRICKEELDGSSLRDIGAAVIRSSDPVYKASWTIAAYERFFTAGTTLDKLIAWGSCVDIGEGERPSVPGLTLVHPSKMPNIGKGGSVRSQAMILHALVHVELAAIDLSWDIIIRDWNFPDWITLEIPRFLLDWLEVAYEECKHFLILRNRLVEIGYNYGQFPCHDGIWADALKTSSSLLERLVLEHCTHEARGIDVCSLMTIPRLRKGGDEISANLLQEVVLTDEIDHVRKGLKYFKLVQSHGNTVEHTEEEYAAAFRAIQERVYGGGSVRGPFAVELRRLAGFSELYYTSP